MENTLVGTKVLKTVTYQIEILGLSEEIPNGLIPDFIKWLQYKAIECGVGKHHEQYDQTANWQDDIGVTFFVISK